MVFEELTDLIKHIDYKNWDITAHDMNFYMYVQVRFPVDGAVPCNHVHPATKEPLNGPHLWWGIGQRFDERPAIACPGPMIKYHAGRKWLISEHATVTEVVRTIHFAIQTAVLHEMNEEFKYRGYRIANSHVDVAQLVRIADITDTRASLEEEIPF